jgi:hypothetical protein
MPQPSTEEVLARIIRDYKSLYQELLYVMAGNIALTKTVCGLAKRVTGISPEILKERIITETLSQHQNLLSRIEDDSPARAAWLDERLPEDVDDALNE